MLVSYFLCQQGQELTLETKYALLITSEVSGIYFLVDYLNIYLIFTCIFS